MNPGVYRDDGNDETPREVQRFRKERTYPVGKSAKHWGVARDANYPPEGEVVVFGRKNRMDGSVRCSLLLLVWACPAPPIY